jgi:hypothetical protein
MARAGEAPKTGTTARRHTRARKSGRENTAFNSRRRLLEVSDSLHPGLRRRAALEELDRLFRAGTVPDPLPDGFLSGRLVGTSTWGPWDGVVQRLARAWMPWRGKSFEAQSSTGLNRFAVLPGVRVGFRILWPTYRPITDGPDRIEAFAFRNRLGEGAVDPGLNVFKIDYNFESNPGFVIRRILDELVQIDEGLYLGKILMRLGGRFRPIGFFMLEATTG